MTLARCGDVEAGGSGMLEYISCEAGAKYSGRIYI